MGFVIHLNNKTYANLAIAGLAACFVGFGIFTLSDHASSHPGHLELPYMGELFIVLGALLAWFHEAAAIKLIWIGAKAYRLASGLAVAAVVGTEGLMHIFSVPHPEGWWMPIMSGGAAATVGLWLKKWKRREPEKG